MNPPSSAQQACSKTPCSTDPLEGPRAAGYVQPNAAERAALRMFVRHKEDIRKFTEASAELRRDAKDTVGVAKEALIEILSQVPGEVLLVPSLKDGSKNVFLKLKHTKTTSHLEDHVAEAVESLTAAEILQVCQEVREAKEAASKPPKRVRRSATVSATSATDAFAPGSVRASFDPTKPLPSTAGFDPLLPPPETPAQKRKRKALEAEEHMVACFAAALRRKLTALSTRENVSVQVCTEAPRKYVHNPAKVTEEFVDLADRFVRGTRTLQELQAQKAEVVKPLQEAQKKNQETVLQYAKKMPELMAQHPIVLEVRKQGDSVERVVVKYDGPKQKPAPLTVKGFEQVARTVLETMFGSRGLAEVPIEKPQRVASLLSDSNFRANLAAGLAAEATSWKLKNAKVSDKPSISLERVSADA